MAAPKTVRERLLDVAEAMEKWPTMGQDDMDGWLYGETPQGALGVILRNAVIPAAQREALRAVLPTLTTKNFAEAAEQIRKVAK